MLKLGVAYTLSLLKYIRKGYGDNMILTSRIAKNYEKIIKSGRYEADKMLSDLEAAYKRKLMTLTEKEYLEGLVQADLENRVEEQVKQLGE
jgi:hypothetical protein